MDEKLKMYIYFIFLNYKIYFRKIYLGIIDLFIIIKFLLFWRIVLILFKMKLLEMLYFLLKVDKMDVICFLKRCVSVWIFLMFFELIRYLRFRLLSRDCLRLSFVFVVFRVFMLVSSFFFIMVIFRFMFFFFVIVVFRF